MATEAGKGEHHVYRIPAPASPDKDPLQPGKHYLGIEAVAWFINKESGWFSSRMASGALDIKLSGGLEKYQVALGTYELRGGARVAPVFERPVLQDRNFVGGPVTLGAFLTAIKKDTVVGGMLKSAANASLGIVAGMVQTATMAGPAKLLSAAGEDLIGGVRRVLTDTAEKREPLFDFGGLEFSIQPQHLLGPETFVLLHRGAALPEDKLEVRANGQLLLPFLNGAMLDDGAWLLLRLRRTSTYMGVRDWFEPAKQLRLKIKALVDDVQAEVVAKDEALKRLRPSSTGDQTLFDEFSKLRAIISADGVLSELEAGARIGELNATLVAARKAIGAQSSEAFDTSMRELGDTLSRGGRPRGAVAKAFTEGAAKALDTRRALAAATGDGGGRRGKKPAALSAADLFGDVSGLSGALFQVKGAGTRAARASSSTGSGASPRSSRAARSEATGGAAASGTARSRGSRAGGKGGTSSAGGRGR